MNIFKPLFLSLSTIACAGQMTYAANYSEFLNPAYSTYSEVHTVTIPNGSVANFASDDMIGDVIRTVSVNSGYTNPDGLTHSGILVNENPLKLLNETKQLKKNGLFDRAERKLFKKNIRSAFAELIDAEDYDSLHPFCLEATGTVSQVLQFILPHVQLTPLKISVEDYAGNVSFRPLTIGIDQEYSHDFIVRHIGRSYEFQFTELMKSAYGLNETSNATQVFCSEIVGEFYQGCGILPSDYVTCNIIPAYFSSQSSNDIIKGYATEDVFLKKTFTASESGVIGKAVGGIIDAVYGEE